MSKNESSAAPAMISPAPAAAQTLEPKPAMPPAPKEIGGRGGLDPVRYGDWEKNGRCIDF